MEAFQSQGFGLKVSGSNPVKRKLKSKLWSTLLKNNHINL